MRISDWSSDVCSSDLLARLDFPEVMVLLDISRRRIAPSAAFEGSGYLRSPISRCFCSSRSRSEEHTSELQSLMRISYAVFCLKKKNKQKLHEQAQQINVHEETQ